MSLSASVRFFALPVLFTMLGVSTTIAQSPVAASDAEEDRPISPKTSPGPKSLDACIEMGFKHSPALEAANASLAAAESGRQGVRGVNKGFARFARKDLPIREEQSDLGVTIAGAALTQANWDVRYAITRNFFTVQYIRSQQKVIADVLKSLNDGYRKAKTIFDSGDPNSKITQLDLDAIKIQIAVVNAKKATADNGMLRALAALREAMGLGSDYPLEIAEADLPPVYFEIKKGDDKKASVEYVKAFKLNKAELIKSAISNRGEIIQASSANLLTALEVEAQSKSRKKQVMTFAGGGDIHVQPIPYSIFNGQYRPGAIGPEMPAYLSGNKADRVQRAEDLHRRSGAVVEKATNLVALDVEDQYLKLEEAAEEYKWIKSEYDVAQSLPARVLKLMQNKDLTGGAIIQANLTAVLFRTQLNEAVHTHALALAGLERATAGAFRVYPPAKKD